VAQLFNDAGGQLTPPERIRDLQRQSLLDNLTGLANRMYLEMNLQARLAEMRRVGAAFGVVLADIDNFRQVNATFGRPVGDRAIQMVGKTIVRGSRTFDVVGRWGPDEFLAVVAVRKNGDLYAVAERVRALVEQAFIVIPTGVVGATISVGATVADARETLDQLLDRAGMLLSRSREGGGNRVTV
jgi:diguanylate cyclase (GGDEF)-like protein